MRTAIVTGAGSGIGRATALLLAQKGYAVVLVGRQQAPLQEVERTIAAAGGQAQGMPADVSVLAQVEALVARTLAAFGRIDVLVNCAGSAPVVALGQLSARQWQEIVDSNLSSAFYTTRAVWPVMVRQFEEARRTGMPAEGGVVVNISSIASKDPFPGLGAYGAAKAALNVLTLAWAREGHECGIRMVAIAPGAVDTPMFHQVMGGKPVPEGIMLAPDAVAHLVWEAVGGALRHCSGETIFTHRRPA